MKKSANRKKTRVVKIGNIKIGGRNLIAVQSMAKTDPHNINETIKQIRRLEKDGCELIRVAVPDGEAAKKLSKIKEGIHIPLIADIHYDYKLAIESVKQDVQKIRINPGNIGARWKVEEIVKVCKERDIPIRVGGNTGSIKEKYLTQFGGPTAQALVESVLNELNIIESMGFESIVVSLKSSNVRTMIEANRLFSLVRDYPLHLGVTEAGPPGRGEVLSAVGIGTLLAEGLGDTIRVSLTCDPVKEVTVAYSILRALGLRTMGPRIISCPTCGRLEFDMERVLGEIEKRVEKIKEPLTIAVMGCSVNGPGEAKEADIGVAGGKNSAVIFKKGKIVATAQEKDIIEVFLSELNTLIEEDIWR